MVSDKSMLGRFPSSGITGIFGWQQKIPVIPDAEANGTEIFRNKIPEFWVYIAKLS